MKRAWWTLAVAALCLWTPSAALRADDGSVIDVLMLYTPEVRAGVGGTAAIQTTLSNAVAEVNAALTNSNVSFQYRIVHMAEADYTGEPGHVAILRHLRETDGVLDQVPVLRNTHNADLVHMVLETNDLNDSCGSGYLRRASDSDAAAATWAYSITLYGCLNYVGSRYQMGHAFGHNFGVQHYPGHEHSDGRTDSPPLPITPYAYGYVDPQNRFCDIMAGDCPSPGPNATGDYNCPRLQRYSNITTTWNGAPVGNASNGNAARVMNDLRVSVSNYRSAATTPTPTPTPTVGPTPTPGPGPGPVNVVWTQLVQASASGNTLTKSGTMNEYDAGAISMKTIPSGDGFVEFTTRGMGFMAVGLGVGNSSQHYSDIDFAVFTRSSGTFSIMEKGNVLAVGGGTYAVGDVFRVEIVGGGVRYRRNGSLLHTSTQAVAYPLVVDTALYTPGVQVGDAKMGSSSMTNDPPMAEAGGPYAAAPGAALTLNGTGSMDHDGSIVSYAWSFGDGTTGTGAVVTHTYAAGTYTATLTVTDNGGLTASDTAAVTIAAPAPPVDVVWTQLVQASASGNTLTKTGTMNDYDAGAISLKSIPSGDGFVEFTARGMGFMAVGLGVGNSSQHYSDIDFAVFTRSSGTFSIMEKGNVLAAGGTYAVGDVFRVEIVNAVARYLRNGSVVYTSSQAPAYPLVVDTALYSPGVQVGSARMGSSTPSNDPPIAEAGGPYSGAPGQAIAFNGSASTDGDGSITSYAWTFGDGTSGTGVSPSHAYAAAGDYVATLTVTDNGGLTASDTATVTVGVPLNVANVVWTNLVQASASSNTLTKTGGNSAYDAGAISSQSIPSGNGYVEFTASGLGFMAVGFGVGDSSQHYSDVDFAVFTRSTGTFSIMEKGNVLATGGGTYAPGDVFRVEITSGVVRYKRNGTVIHTSAQAVAYPLVVDTALYTPGVQVGSAKIAGAP